MMMILVESTTKGVKVQGRDENKNNGDGDNDWGETTQVTKRFV